MGTGWNQHKQPCEHCVGAKPPKPAGSCTFCKGTPPSQSNSAVNGGLKNTAQLVANGGQVGDHPECNVNAGIDFTFTEDGYTSTGSWHIRHSPDVDPIEAIKAATHEWAMGEGRRRVVKDGKDLDWYDTMEGELVPEETFAAHGVVFVSTGHDTTYESDKGTPAIQSLEATDVVFSLDEYDDAFFLEIEE